MVLTGYLLVALLTFIGFAWFSARRFRAGASWTLKHRDKPIAIILALLVMAVFWPVTALVLALDVLGQIIIGRSKPE